jgi:hypothetical protein
MDCDEIEDEQELSDETVKEEIAESRKDKESDKVRPATEILNEIKGGV